MTAEERGSALATAIPQHREAPCVGAGRHPMAGQRPARRPRLRPVAAGSGGHRRVLGQEAVSLGPRPALVPPPGLAEFQLTQGEVERPEGGPMVRG